MLLLAKGIEHQRVHAFEQRPRRLRNFTAVGQIRKSAHPEPKDQPMAVEHRHRDELVSTQAERAGDERQVHLRHPTARERRLLEDIGEGPPQIARGVAVRIARHGFPLEAVVAAHFVEAEDVIGVAVREQNRVEAPDVVRERLGTQVARGVHQHVPRRAMVGGRARRQRVGAGMQVDQNGWTASAVARIGRLAHVAVAADHRHAVRRAAAEHGNSKAQ